MAALNYSDVSKLLKADFETGKLFWLPRPVDMFPSARLANTWNARYSGTEAFTADDGHGYKVGNILNHRYAAHRVIWLLYSGDWPHDQIDHVNGVRVDNRICNLRPVSNAVNSKNQKLRSTNTSGVQGVVWDAGRKKWGAQIKVDGANKHLGRFSEFDDAVAARRLAETEYGFHPNHGR